MGYLWHPQETKELLEKFLTDVAQQRGTYLFIIYL
jgi:hypothetical protein